MFNLSPPNYIDGVGAIVCGLDVDSVTNLRR